MGMKKIRVRREDRSVVFVEVEDRQHYEVFIDGDDGEPYERYEYVAADNVQQVKRTVELDAEAGETIGKVLKISAGHAAVMKLNGATIRRAAA